MNVALFLPNLQGGGAQRSVINLAKGLNYLGCSCHLVVANAAQPILRVPDGVSVHSLGASRALASIPALSKFLQNYRPDVFLSTLNYANICAYVSLRMSGCGAVFIAREANTLQALKFDGWRGRVMLSLLEPVYRRATAVVVNSGHSREDLLRAGLAVPERVCVIPNPVVDDDLLVSQAAVVPHSWLEKKNGPVVVSVGRLVRQKGFDVLLRAFQQVNVGSGVRLIILGEGPDRVELEGLVRYLGLEDVVSIPGFAGNPHPYYANADVFVLASRWEGLPSVLIEAMAAGCPVVATDAPGGSAELLAGGDYGRLVPVDDEQALAEAISATLRNPPRADLLRSRAGEYSVERVTRQYLEMFEECLANRAG